MKTKRPFRMKGPIGLNNNEYYHWVTTECKSLGDIQNESDNYKNGINQTRGALRAALKENKMLRKVIDKMRREIAFLRRNIERLQIDEISEGISNLSRFAEQSMKIKETKEKDEEI